MQFIYTHPSRAEALVATTNRLTRWNIASMPTPMYGANLAGPLMVVPDGTAIVPSRYRQAPTGVVEIRTWEDFSLDRVIPIPHSRSSWFSGSFSHDGRWLAVADAYERIYLVEYTADRVIATAKGSTGTTGLKFSPDASSLAAVCTAQGGGFIGVWRIGVGGLQIPPLRLESSALAWRFDMDMADTGGELAFSPDGRLLAACLTSHWLEAPGVLSLYDVETGRMLWHIALPDHANEEGWYTQVLFTPDGTGIVYGTQAGEVAVRQVADGSLADLVQTGAGQETYALALDRLGRGMWTVGKDGTPMLGLISGFGFADGR